MRVRTSIFALLCTAGSACAQSAPQLPVPATQHPSPERLKEIPLIDNDENQPPAVDTNDPAVRAQLEAARRDAALERELRKLRFKFFSSAHGPTREKGLDQLKHYTGESTFGVQLRVFEHDNADVKGVLLRTFREARTETGDRAMAWLAVSDGTLAVRELAKSSITARTDELRKTPPGVLGVINGAILAGTGDQQLAGAGLASTLKLYETIPALLVASLPGDEDRQGDLAWISIATQTAYNASVTPVVATNSVGFQPVPAVLTTGTILRVHDATVQTVRETVNLMPALHGLASAVSGSPTTAMGKDPQQWGSWYTKVYQPFMTRRAAAAQAADLPLGPSSTGN